jgi:hypothetical protein
MFPGAALRVHPFWYLFSTDSFAAFPHNLPWKAAIERSEIGIHAFSLVTWIAMVGELFRYHFVGTVSGCE